MANPDYYGVNGVARKVKEYYYGVGGVARKVTAMYFGDANGKAQLVYRAIENVDTPTQKNTLTYSGSAQSPTWNNYDSTKLTLGGTTSATNAGTYTATFTPKSGYAWADGTTTARSVSWTIGRAVVSAVPTQKNTLTYTGSSLSPTWNNYDTAKLTLGGTKTATGAGTYTATFTPTANYMWSGGSTAAKNASWTIGKATPATPTLSKTSISLTESSKTATFTVSRSGTGAISAVSSNTAAATVSVSGTTVTVTGKATGSATITVTVAADSNYNAYTGTGARCSVSVTIITADYLCFTSSAGFTLKVNDGAKHWNGTVQYSTDGASWTTWNGTGTLSASGKLYLRGTGNTVITGSSRDYGWTLSGKSISASGDIETLLDYATVAAGNHPTIGAYCFASMFRGNTALISAPKMPSSRTAMAQYACAWMFRNCTGLTTAPEMNSVTLAAYCYQGMFYGCTGMTTPMSALPAGEAYPYCYADMFNGCTSLQKPPAIHLQYLEPHSASFCCSGMFYGCSALTAPAVLFADNLADHCYSEMYAYCSRIRMGAAGVYGFTYRIPYTGTATEKQGALTMMFTGTGGTFTGTPSINTTYSCQTEPVA